MNNNSSLNQHCFSCGKQLQTNSNTQILEKYQIPICNQTTDVISLEKHLMCGPCLFAFQSIKKFVDKFHLKWFNRDFKLQKIMSPQFIKMCHIDTSFTKQNRRSQIIQTSSLKNTEEDAVQIVQSPEGLHLNVNPPNDIYSAIINNTIESSSFHHVYWLPKTVQYFIHLTSTDKMRPQQRKQRVRKTLQILCYLYCIDQKDLKYLAIIVQSLFCCMDEGELLKILDKLLKGFLKNSISISVFMPSQVTEENSILEQKQYNKKPIQYRPEKIFETMFSILILMDYYRDSKLKKHIQQIINLSIEELNLEKQKFAAQTLQKKYQQYLKKNISQNHSKQTQIGSNTFQQLMETKRQQNHFNLIIRTIKREQDENQELIKQMQSKHKKQKDEYINKIIKLNNKIDNLENQLQSLKINNQKIILQNNQQKQSNINNQQEVKSNPQLKISAILKQQTIQQVRFSSQVPNSETKCTQQGQIKKHKSEVEVQNQVSENVNQHYLNYMKSILQITDIVAFNTKSNKKSSSFPLSQLPNTVKQLTQIIITQVNNLQKRVSHLVQENKKFKDESARVLSILKRKEQTWLPLFHQKDQIISLYQKALICLQNGVILAEQPLKSRIQTIVQKVSKVKFMKMEDQDDDNSMRDSIRDSFVEEVTHQRNSKTQKTQNKQKQKDSPPPKLKSKLNSGLNQQKNQELNKIKQKTKKGKQKESDCQIY